jgi:hypothetical protein
MDRRGLLLRLSAAVEECSAALHSGVHFDEEERVFLENNMLQLQIAYVTWKARQTKSTTER